MNEQELIDSAQRGSNSAKTELLKMHKGLIRSISKRYATWGDIEDFEQEANIAFLKAIEIFDKSRECKLTTIASVVISRALSLHKQHQPVILGAPIVEGYSIHSTTPEDEVLQKEQIAKLRGLLNNEDMKVVELLLRGDKTLAEMGRKRGRTRENMRQLEQKWIKRLRAGFDLLEPSHVQ